MKLDQVLSSASAMPSIPKVVQDLIVEFQNENVNMDSIGRKLQTDPVLSAKVLRLANSAKYGRNKNIESIDSAIVLLGLPVVKLLIVASGVSSVFPKSIDTNRLWEQSFLTAIVARMIASNIKADVEAAFTSGLLHNIGEILVASKLHDEFLEYQSALPQSKSLEELETRLFGKPLAEVGATLARHWKFPSNTVHAIAFQNTADVKNKNHQLAAVIYASKAFIKASNDDTTAEVTQNSRVIEVVTELGIDSGLVLNALPACLDEAEDYVKVING